MKAKITKLTFKGERDGKFGKEYNYQVEYDGKSSYFTSKSKEIPFKENEEAEFTETELESKQGNKYTVIKLIKQGYGKSPYNKALQKEQSRYSGFSTSYAKDLAVAGLIKVDDIENWSTKLFNHMVELDKTLIA